MTSSSTPAPTTDTFVCTSFTPLLKSGDFADLEVICGDKRWAVHKAIVCSRSTFFRIACNDRFKEGRTGEFDLSKEDPWTVKTLLEFIYGGAYDLTKDSDDEPYYYGFVKTYPTHHVGDADLLANVRLYVAAEYYGVKGLKRFAYDQVSNILYDDEKFRTFDESWTGSRGLSFSTSGVLQATKQLYDNVTGAHKSIRRLFLYKICHTVEEYLRVPNFTEFHRDNRDFAMDALREMSDMKNLVTGNYLSGQFFCFSCEDDAHADEHFFNCEWAENLRTCCPLRGDDVDS